MKQLLLVSLFAMFSCTEKEVPSDFDLRVIDLVIETRNGQAVELPDLYGKVFVIADSVNETLILSKKLQTRGFKITATKSDVQGFTGTRIITQNLVKDGCHCEVTKTYGRTAYVGQYAVSEKIRCQ